MIIETLFELFRVKGSFKEHICSGIVYRFTCFNCNVHYYGRASCYFYNRAAERNITNHAGTGALKILISP